MKFTTCILALMLTAAAPTAAFAQPAQAAPAAPAAAYSTETTDIGTLLSNPATKAILDKNLPGFSANPQIDMARSMTLKSVQQYSPDMLTDAKLAAIDADLAKVPVKK
jgi:para-nitrobenzyl esterase